jgi:hypothetical protein
VIELRRRIPNIAVGFAAVVLLAGAAVALYVWWPATADEPARGTPRLVIDRREVDLGPFRYGVQATAVFTLANTGDAPVKVLGAPTVTAVKGC